MANRRRRERPVQDEGRKDRKDSRQRNEQSRVQRERIERQRDRRERRREIRRAKRQQVDSVRSPKEDLRTERFESRLLPVEDSFLARPVGTPHELPVLIGERWGLDVTEATADGVEESVPFDTPVFTTERNGYPALYDGVDTFRIPAGLAGIWRITTHLQWSIAANITTTTKVRKNATDTVASILNVTHATHATFLTAVALLSEADTIDVRVIGSGSVGEITGEPNQTYVFFEFLGK